MHEYFPQIGSIARHHWNTQVSIKWEINTYRLNDKRGNDLQPKHSNPPTESVRWSCVICTCHNNSASGVRVSALLSPKITPRFLNNVDFFCVFVGTLQFKWQASSENLMSLLLLTSTLRIRCLTKIFKETLCL